MGCDQSRLGLENKGERDPEPESWGIGSCADRS